MNRHDEVLAAVEPHLGRLRRAGGDNASAACPFHGTKTGTPFSINLSNGLWHCFTCHERGNLYTLLRAFGMGRQAIEYHHGTLVSALRGQSSPGFDPIRPKVWVEEPLPDVTLGLFDYCPTPLLEQGFSEEMLRDLDIGFDEKHLRMTFPLRDLDGALLGISGRTVIGEDPKYKVYTKEYEAFGLPGRSHPNKDIVLWNVHRVYPAQFLSEEPEPIVVVEGFKACMRMLQHGFRNTVAVLGTYLSPPHRWILERMGGPVYLMLDNDGPGRHATYLSGLSITGLPTRVVPYHQPQPDELTQEEAAEAVASAIPWHRWVLEQQRAGNHDVLRKRSQAARRPAELPPVDGDRARSPSVFDREG